MLNYYVLSMRKTFTNEANDIENFRGFLDSKTLAWQIMHRFPKNFSRMQ